MIRVARRALDFLTVVGERQVPQITIRTLGVIGAGLGLLILFQPDKFQATQSLMAVFHAASPVVWGCALFGVGVSLATVGVIDHSKASPLCGVLGLLMFVFAFLSAVGVVRGTGLGIVSWCCLGLGWLCFLNALAAVAPQLRRSLV